MAILSYITPSKELQEVVPIDLSVFTNQERRFDDYGSDWVIVKEGDDFKLRLDKIGPDGYNDPQKAVALIEEFKNYSGIVERYLENSVCDGTKHWMALVFYRSTLVSIHQGPVVFWTKYPEWSIEQLNTFIESTVDDNFGCLPKPLWYATQEHIEQYPLKKLVLRGDATRRVDISLAGWLYKHESVKSGLPIEWKEIPPVRNALTEELTDVCSDPLSEHSFNKLKMDHVKHIQTNSDPDFPEFLIFYNDTLIGAAELDYVDRKPHYINQNIFDFTREDLVKEWLTESGLSVDHMNCLAVGDLKLYIRSDLIDFCKSIKEDYNPNK